MYGVKRWALMPPPHAVYTREHPLSWFRMKLKQHRDRGEALSCVQHSGDILYVPDGWGHGILNTAETAGYALRCCMKLPDSGTLSCGPNLMLNLVNLKPVRFSTEV